MVLSCLLGIIIIVKKNRDKRKNKMEELKELEYRSDFSEMERFRKMD